MKFITENELRDLYKIAPFDRYIPNDGERLTPGARQFLMDRGMLDFEEQKSVYDTGLSQGFKPINGGFTNSANQGEMLVDEIALKSVKDLCEGCRKQLEEICKNGINCKTKSLLNSEMNKLVNAITGLMIDE